MLVITAMTVYHMCAHKKVVASNFHEFHDHALMHHFHIQPDPLERALMGKHA